MHKTLVHIELSTRQLATLLGLLFLMNLFVLALLGAMGVLLVGLQLFIGKADDLYAGIPRNWMPSAVAFAVALVSLCLFASLPREGDRGGLLPGLLVTTKDARTRLGIAAWAGFTALALTLGRQYSPELTFAGFACLLASLLAYVLRQQLLAGAHASGSAFAAAPQLTKVGPAV